jgi:hypothetical protein
MSADSGSLISNGQKPSRFQAGLGRGVALDATFRRRTKADVTANWVVCPPRQSPRYYFDRSYVAARRAEMFYRPMALGKGPSTYGNAKKVQQLVKIGSIGPEIGHSAGR